MNYEQKYKDALERARECMKDGGISQNTIDYLCNIFPELAESEDERMRKELVAFLKEELYTGGRAEETWDMKGLERWISWLEKQGEHKSVDKVEPKFQNGQWVVWQNKCYKVNYNGCGYELIDQNGLTTSCEYGTIDENAHIWTIADAKPGSVLVCKGNIKYSNGIKYERICLFKNLDNAFFTLTKPSNGFGEYYNIDVNIDYPDNTVPATKEQKEILFMTMKEAGYEWDADTKELKNANKIEPKFHEGDWLQYRNAKPFFVEEITKQGYVNGDSCLPFNYENEIHIWTIEDAKPGDVLCSLYCKLLWLYKDKKTCYVGYNFYSGSIVVNSPICIPIDARPAIKEECDTLTKAMADNGYTFDFEKKELKEVEEEVNGEDYDIDGLYHAQRILEKTIGSVDGYQTDDGILEHKCAISAVKKLLGIKKQSEEFDDNIITREDEILQAITIGLTDIAKDLGWSDFGGLPIEEIQDWLDKKGKWKVGYSVEDEKIRKVLINYFKLYKEQEECGIITFYGIPTDDILAWLEKQEKKGGEE